MKNLLPIFALGFMACESSTSPGSVSSSTVQESSSSVPISSSAVAAKCPYVADDVFGVAVDPRDGQCYRTIQVGNKIWWYDALKYQIPGAKCYSTDTAQCRTGLYYTWAEAMNGWQSSNNMPSGVQGLCPDGWVLPSEMDWKMLYYQMRMGHIPYVERVTVDNPQTKITSLSYSYSFRADWSSTESSQDSAVIYHLYSYNSNVDDIVPYAKTDSASIRCMKVVE